VIRLEARQMPHNVCKQYAGHMQQLTTLFDRDGALDDSVLPGELRALYSGDLRFPTHPDQTYVIGNFVSTLDGVVSYEIPDKSGGGEISGFNAADRFIMGLLRASADAIVVGAGTLQDTADGHLWLAEAVYPNARELYAEYRQHVLNKPEPPLNVIVTGSGAVDLQKAVFRTPGVRALIITSPNGKQRLASNDLEALPSVETRVLDGSEGKISPEPILKLLRDEFTVNHLLHEGGPKLFGDFVAHGCVDELFLTMAPQFAGRDSKRERPGVISGTEFVPETAPWFKLISVKQSADHLFLRYTLLNRVR
jgi:riboflavin biosynthesis pyrimidine reductase